MVRKNQTEPVAPPATLEDAEACDRADPLASARAQFALDEGLIYLDGHSLGPATHGALRRVQTTAQEEWARGLIRSWNDADWIALPQRVGARLAPLLGVAGEEVLVTDSVSVNLFKLAAAVSARVRRRELVVEADEFPTDQYVAASLGELLSVPVRRVASGEGAPALQGGGVLLKSVVNYRTAKVADVAEHEAAAQAGGGAIVWDLSHAAGVLDLRLADWGVRYATGCTYKYLNGGPGAPAYIVVRGPEADSLHSPIAGWFGHAAPFAFSPDYQPLPGVGRFAAGTPGVLSLAALDAALEAFEGVTPADLEVKARRLGQIWTSRAQAAGLSIASPVDDAQRGGHVTLLHPEAYAIVQALIARGVIGDFRAPDAMRFGFAPLYLTHSEVWRAFDALLEVLHLEAWRAPEHQARARVT